jgi:branched-chain amino acid transport system permease protein
MSVQARVQGLGGRQRIALLAVAAVLAVVAPFVVGAFQTALLAEVLMLAVFATAFNLLYGYTGLLSFGHAMFVATAAYTVAKVFRLVGPAIGLEAFGGLEVLVTLVVAVLLGTLLTTLLAVGVGYLSVQLTEIYFAMITLSFSMAIYVLFNQDIMREVADTAGLGGLADLLATNGSDGLTISFTALGEIDLFGFSFQLVNIGNFVAVYFVCLLVFVVAMYAMWRIVNSPFGMTCKAIRENPGRAEALGINVTRHSWKTFILSGAFSGIAGSMIAVIQSGALPNIAYWSFSAEPVIMTVIGGPYYFLGPLAGAITFRYLRWGIDTLGYSANWQFVFGTLLLIVVLFARGGVAGAITRGRDWLRKRGGDEESAGTDSDAAVEGSD